MRQKHTLGRINDKMKLLCKNCEQPCCEGHVSVKITDDSVIILPLTKKELFIDGIHLIRITQRLWRCKWYDPKKKKCKNYRFRPPVCKRWFCKDYKGKGKIRDTLNTSVYRLCFPRNLTNKRKVN